MSIPPECDASYFSLSPGTYPRGQHVSIRNVAAGQTIRVPMRMGGLDPMEIDGCPGDELDLEIENLDGERERTTKTIPASGVPGIVRVGIPITKTDIPVNMRFLVVFTEPINPSVLALTPIYLRRGRERVPGVAQPADARGLVVQFIPAGHLAPNTAYELVVTKGIRDLDGESLASGGTVGFTTGTVVTGPPAFIQLFPDTTVFVDAGDAYQATATVHDAFGTTLTDVPMSWSGSIPNKLTISPTGLLTAFEGGFYKVFVTAGSLSQHLNVIVVGDPPIPANVSISASAPKVPVGDTIVVTATVVDQMQRVINEPGPIIWALGGGSTSVTVVPTALSTVVRVIGVREGRVTLFATIGDRTASEGLDITAPVPVASVELTPTPLQIAVTATSQLTAMLRDATGRQISGRTLTWRSDDENVAAVDATGLVTALKVGSATIAATSGGVQGTAVVHVSDIITFASIGASATEFYNGEAPAGFPGQTCGLTPQGEVYCWGILFDRAPEATSVPTILRTQHRFTTISVGGTHACGLVASGAGYCWGENLRGQLGGGASAFSGSEFPMEMSGLLTFASLAMGEQHSCGLTRAGAAYCWGDNLAGQIGRPLEPFRQRNTVPDAVVGEHVFVALKAGANHTCGLTASGSAYCWGSQWDGQLGDGVSGVATGRFTPALVQGGVSFASLALGYNTSCGLTSEGAAYCWGAVSQGTVPPRLLNGSGTLRLVTLAVSLTDICGLTSTGEAYCWPSTEIHNPPRAVSGALVFSSISSGYWHTCGVATGGIAYCWGSNDTGQLGDGTLVSRIAPVRVGGPS
jgi:hypothetical protein